MKAVNEQRPYVPLDRAHAADRFEELSPDELHELRCMASGIYVHMKALEITFAAALEKVRGGREVPVLRDPKRVVLLEDLVRSRFESGESLSDIVSGVPVLPKAADKHCARCRRPLWGPPWPPWFIPVHTNRVGWEFIKETVMIFRVCEECYIEHHRKEAASQG